MGATDFVTHPVASSDRLFSTATSPLVPHLISNTPSERQSSICRRDALWCHNTTQHSTRCFIMIILFSISSSLFQPPSARSSSFSIAEKFIFKYGHHTLTKNVRSREIRSYITSLQCNRQNVNSIYGFMGSKETFPAYNNGSRVTLIHVTPGFLYLYPSGTFLRDSALQSLSF